MLYKRGQYHFHFTDYEIEAEERKVTCPRSLRPAAELGLAPRSPQSHSSTLSAGLQYP